MVQNHCFHASRDKLTPSPSQPQTHGGSDCSARRGGGLPGRPVVRTGARRRRFYGEERGTGEAEYQGAAVVTIHCSGSDNSVW